MKTHYERRCAESLQKRRILFILSLLYITKASRDARNVSPFVRRQHEFHRFKDDLIIELFHANDVIRTTSMPVAERRLMMAEQAAHVAEQANRRRVWRQPIARVHRAK